MLTLSAIVLAATALFGLCLFALYQWTEANGRIWLPGMAHGLLGAVGFVLLLLGLRGPPRGVAMGAGQFGVIAAGLVACGLLLGGLVFLGRLRRRPPAALVIGLHATLAVGGLVMLAAYLSAPV
jgi:hypothetical protein